MKRVFIETENVVKFQHAMKVLSDTEKGNPGLGVVYGIAGRGKTWACKRYSIQNNSAVYIRVLQSWTDRAMLAHICTALGLQEHSTVDKCRQEIVKFLDSRNICLLIDEADRLSHAQVEHLRDLHDLSGVVVVFVGEQQLKHLLEAKRRVWSRITQMVEFGPVTSEDIVLFAYKATGLKILPETAERIGTITNGDFRRVYHVVRNLEQFARTNKIKEISADMLDHVEIISLGVKVGKAKSM